VLVDAGRWLGQQHQNLHVLGRSQVAKITSGLVRMMPPARRADTRLAAETPTDSKNIAPAPGLAAAAPTDLKPSRPSEPLLVHVPVSVTGVRPKLAWVTDGRTVRVRPRPASASRLSVTTGGDDTRSQTVTKESPYLTPHGEPADRQVAKEPTDTRRR
jgi:hypothetical protein